MLGLRPKQTALWSKPWRKPEDLGMWSSLFFPVSNSASFSSNIFYVLCGKFRKWMKRLNIGKIYFLRKKKDKTNKLRTKNGNSSVGIICLSSLQYDFPGPGEVGPGAPQGLRKGQFKQIRRQQTTATFETSHSINAGLALFWSNLEQITVAPNASAGCLLQGGDKSLYAGSSGSADCMIACWYMACKVWIWNKTATDSTPPSSSSDELRSERVLFTHCAKENMQGLSVAQAKKCTGLNINRHTHATYPWMSRSTQSDRGEKL